MALPIYNAPVDLTGLATSGVGWPASLAEAKKLPPEQCKKLTEAALKVPTVKAYIKDCTAVGQILAEKIEYDAMIDLASAEIAIIVAWFSSLNAQTNIPQKTNEAKDAVVQAALKLPNVIKQNWDTIKPYVYGRNGTTLDCALYGWHRDGAIERPEVNPPPLYVESNGQKVFQPENYQFYAKKLPPVKKGSASGWPQLFDWVTIDDKVREILKAVYGGGILTGKALYPAVVQYIDKQLSPTLSDLLIVWEYNSPQSKKNKQDEKSTYEQQIKSWTDKRKELAESYTVALKQLPSSLLQVPAGFLRDVAWEAGGAVLATMEAEAHAAAAEKLAEQAEKTLLNSAEAVQDAREEQFGATGSGTRGALDFGDGGGTGSSAKRAGAAYAAAHAASKRAGANKRNGKAKTENDAARSLIGVAEEKSRNLGTDPPPSLGPIKQRTEQTDATITDNANTVIDQGDKLKEVLSHLTEIDSRTIIDTIDKNSDDAEKLLKPSGLPWWVFALAGLAYLRR